MFVKCIQFAIAKSLVNDLRKAALNGMHNENEPALQDRLGFSSIHEYMTATTDEIKQRQRCF